jgi:AraC family ethanolamine operon transcriptional activator
MHDESSVSVDPTHRFAPTLGAAHKLRASQAQDADEHAHNLTGWEQSYDQITPGRFQGSLIELQLPHIQVFRECISHAVRQSCCVRPAAYWFGLGDQNNDMRINGRVAGPNQLMVRPGQGEFELVTPANHTIYGIVIQRDALEAAANLLNCQIEWAQLGQAEMIRVDPAARLACQQTLHNLLAYEPCSVLDQLVGLQAVTETLLTMLDTSQIDSRASKSFERRQSIVAKARDYVLNHRDQAVTVPQLCEQLYVSRRTLQYCFEDVLDLSPMQYLRLIRLNGARRSLREPLSAAVSVRDVAANWGFWHFSQFSSDYRKLFGQCPSESRMQAAH